MLLGKRRLQHHEAEKLVDAQIAVDQPFDDQLVFVDPRRHELHKVIVTARDQMAFDAVVDVAKRFLKAGKVDLAVVLQREFGEDGQGRPQPCQIDLRNSR